MNHVLRKFICEPPFRLVIKALLMNSVARRYAFDWAALFDAHRHTPYAVGLQLACKYAKLAGAGQFTAIEFGVAGGSGLIEMTRHARVLSDSTGMRIKVVGFDGASGLPPGSDYRDAPWLWNPGDFPCNVDRLHSLLPSGTELVLGPIEKTFPRWLSEKPQPPIGFIGVDVDYYSSTAAICEALGNADVNRLLPMVSLYFDDILRYLTPNCTGELAAIAEFNSSHSCRQFGRNDWLSEDRPFGEGLWLKRMYSLYSFDHAVMQRHQDRELARLDLTTK
jgi:hypothetical protein